MVSDCELYSYLRLGPLHKSHLTWSKVYCNTTTATITTIHAICYATIARALTLHTPSAAQLVIPPTIGLTIGPIVGALHAVPWVPCTLPVMSSDRAAPSAVAANHHPSGGSALAVHRATSRCPSYGCTHILCHAAVRLGTPPSSLDDVMLEWNKPKDEDEGPKFESWRMKLVFQLNTDISRSNWRFCPIGQHLVNLIVDKQFDTCVWCLIVNSTAIRA